MKKNTTGDGYVDIVITKDEAEALIMCAADGLAGDGVSGSVKKLAIHAIEKLNVIFDLRIHEAGS